MTSSSGYAGWLFLRDAPPARWADRAQEGFLVPLLPNETASLLEGTPAVPQIPAEDEPLAALVARGLTAPAIAHELGLSERSVQRRLAGLRRRLGVQTKADLAALLIQRGFA